MKSFKTTIKKLSSIKKVTICITFFFSCIASFGQTPNWAWAKNVSDGGSDYPASITAKDHLGNVYIAGSFEGSITFGNITLSNVRSGGNLWDLWDIYIVKYDPSGNVIWARSDGGIYDERIRQIATDSSGNVYITGAYFSPSIAFDSITINNPDNTPLLCSHIFIAKYNSSGNVLWAKDAGGGHNDMPNSIAPDSHGNVYLTGQFVDSVKFDNISIIVPYGGSNFFFVKYSSSGTVLWAKSAEAFATRISTDASGNIYITGGFQRPSIVIGNNVLTNAGAYNMFIAKYDSQGNVLWAKSIDGNVEVDPNDITSDKSGNVYIIGSFSSSIINFGNTTLTNTNIGNEDHFIAKYDPSGNVLWAKSIGENSDLEPLSITIDESGDVYIAGGFTGATITFSNITLTNSIGAGWYDFFIVKYDSLGNVPWAKSLSAGIPLSFLYGQSPPTIAITADASNNIYVTGYWGGSTITFDNTAVTIGTGGATGTFIAKLSNTGVGINENKNDNPDRVYPNPFSSTAIVSFTSNEKKQKHVFEMFDVLGNKVKSEEIPANSNFFEISRDNLDKGLYFYQISSDGKTSSSGKLMIQ